MARIGSGLLERIQRIMEGMDVELLVVPGCPNQQPAASLLRAALDDLGLRTMPVRTTVIATNDDADRRGFTGSPTILIDGHDPFSVPGAQPALACRVYANVSGPTGVPPLRDLRQALKRAADMVTPTNR